MNKNDMQFDREELQILRDFERGEFQTIDDFAVEKRELEAAARNTLWKDGEINIRISSHDLDQLHAAREGMPFQTYIGGSLHELASPVG